jgi:hypothetical protein
LRLWFVLAEATDNEVLWLWTKALAQECPGAVIDPRVMQATQPIFTARPIFRGGATDPVPEWGRVRMLDGFAEALALDLKGIRKPKPYVPPPRTEGLAPGEVSNRAWRSICKVYARLDHCPHNGGGMGRHETLNLCAWILANLIEESELPEETGRRAFMDAAQDIWNGDNKYDDAAIERHFKEALADARKRRQS